MSDHKAYPAFATHVVDSYNAGKAVTPGCNFHKKMNRGKGGKVIAIPALPPVPVAAGLATVVDPMSLTRLVTLAVSSAEKIIIDRKAGATKYDIVIHFISKYGAGLLGVDQATLEGVLETLVPPMITCMVEFASHTTEIHNALKTCCRYSCSCMPCAK